MLEYKVMPKLRRAEQVNSPRRVCYICTWNALGGSETLILRHLNWLQREGRRGIVVSPAGAMSESFRNSASLFIELTEAQADEASMSTEELSRRNDEVADAIGLQEPCHFVALNEDGLYFASELAGRIKGSAVSVYLVFDDIYGPDKLSILDQMNDVGMVIAMNEGCLEGHRRRYGYRFSSSHLTPLPMALPDLPAIAKAGQECVILTVARLVDMKGYIEGLIKDYASIARSTTIPSRLVIVGEGPLRGRFEKIAADAGIRDRVEFAGSVPYASLNDYYRRAHVYVGMGTTVLEASAVGLPAVIATAHTRDFISPGLFSSDDRLELGETFSGKPIVQGRLLLKELIESRETREREGVAGRLKVIAQFETDRVMQRFISHLETNAYLLSDMTRPKSRASFKALRKLIKRSFRYHPMIMWLGRSVSRLAGRVLRSARFRAAI